MFTCSGILPSWQCTLQSVYCPTPALPGGWVLFCLWSQPLKAPPSSVCSAGNAAPHYPRCWLPAATAPRRGCTRTLAAYPYALFPLLRIAHLPLAYTAYFHSLLDQYYDKRKDKLLFHLSLKKKFHQFSSRQQMTHANWVIKKLMKGRLHKIIYNLAGRALDTLQ